MSPALIRMDGGLSPIDYSCLRLRRQRLIRRRQGWPSIVSCGLGRGRAVAAKPDFHQQAFIAHPADVAARDADVRQLFRPDLTAFTGERDSSVPQARLWAAGQRDPLRAIPIPLAYPLNGLWRNVAWNIVAIVRGFVGPGEAVLIPKALSCLGYFLLSALTPILFTTVIVNAVGRPAKSTFGG